MLPLPLKIALRLLLGAALASACSVLFMLLSDAVGAQRGERQIHQERSLYRNILVTEDSSRRCMRFTITRHQGQNQSCQYLREPEKLVFPYARMVMSSLLVRDDPQRILIVGLGGGTLPETYAKLFPQADILVSEIDEAVVRVAEEFFDFRETDRIKVHVGDGRVHIKRALLREERFDLVILDAFNGEYIPEHLMTAEFLGEVKDLLTPRGMVVANTFSTSKLYDAESVTYQQVFGDFISLGMGGTGNRIIIATPGQPLPDRQTLEQRVPQWRAKLRRFGMDLAEYPPHMSRQPDWDTEARVLTDQYAPVNLLNE